MTSLVAKNNLFQKFSWEDQTYSEYVREIMRIPLLGAAEEVALVQRYQKTGDMDALKKLILSHLRLVIPVAKKFYSYGFDRKDLVQEGNIGLMMAIKRFDLGRKVRLAAYAVRVIKSHVADYVLRNWSMIKIASTQAQRKLFFHISSLFESDNQGKLLPEKAVAEKLAVREEDVAAMRRRYTQFQTLREDGDFDLNAAQDEAMGVEEQMIAREQEKVLRPGLERGLAALSERERAIINRRYLQESKTPFRELAQELGLSIEGVRKIECRALEKIKTHLAPGMKTLGMTPSGA